MEIFFPAMSAYVGTHFFLAKYCYHYIKIIVVRCPSVCLSVTGGHWKQFDLEASVAVYLAMERTKLKLGDLCER